MAVDAGPGVATDAGVLAPPGPGNGSAAGRPIGLGFGFGSNRSVLDVLGNDAATPEKEKLLESELTAGRWTRLWLLYWYGAGSVVIIMPP